MDEHEEMEIDREVAFQQVTELANIVTGQGYKIGVCLDAGYKPVVRGRLEIYVVDENDYLLLTFTLDVKNTLKLINQLSDNAIGANGRWHHSPPDLP